MRDTQSIRANLARRRKSGHMKMFVLKAVLSIGALQSMAMATAAQSPSANGTLLSTPQNLTVSGKLNLRSDPPMIGTTDLPIAYQYQMDNRIPPNLHINPHEMPILLYDLPKPAKQCFAQAIVTCQKVEIWKVVNPASPIVSVVGKGYECKIDKMSCIN